MISFDVYLPSDDDRIDLWSAHSFPYTVEGKAELVLIDTVFGTENMTSEEVRDSLVNHDGYPDNIVVMTGA